MDLIRCTFFSSSIVGESNRRPHHDSHNRLFGDVERPSATPKSYQKSNIPIGSDAIDAPKVTNGNGNANGNGKGNHPIGNGASLNGNGNGALNGNGNGVHENGKGTHKTRTHTHLRVGPPPKTYFNAFSPLFAGENGDSIANGHTNGATNGVRSGKVVGCEKINSTHIA